MYEPIRKKEYFIAEIWKFAVRSDEAFQRVVKELIIVVSTAYAT
jgi:hypothetical protein